MDSTMPRSVPTVTEPAPRPRRRSFSLARLALPSVGIFVFAFLYIPILLVVLFSFNSGNRIGLWEGFSFRWYEELATDREMIEALEVTLWVSTLAMIISTVIGTMAALAMERYQFFGKITADAIYYLPVIIPDIVMALSLLLFFTAAGIDLSRWTILIGHVAFDTAFVIVVVRARLQSMDPKLEEAAADLYASPWRAFRRVTLPLLMPGILSAALLAFTMSFDEFVITSFIGGQGDTTLPVKVFSMLRFGLKPNVNAVAALILLASSILVVVSLVLQARTPGGAARPAGE
jgi:spermidine/putrescine transport system permease protein